MSNQQHTFESISNFNEKHDLENSLHSLENAINFIGTSKSDIDLKNFKIEKFFELERDYRTNLLIYDYEKAIISLKKMIFFDKKSNNFILNIDPKYFAELAKCYIKLHDISSAISCYKKSLLFDNNNKFYLAALEKLLFAKGMISLSEEGKINSDLLNQIKNDMSRTHFHYLKALAFLNISKRDYAIAELEKIISLDKNHIEALVLLGKIYLNEGKYSEGSYYLWQVYYLKPEYPEIKEYISIMKRKMDECLQRANQYIMKNKTDMGLLWSIKALNLYPNHPEALLLRSAIYRKLGRFDECLSDLNLASANMLLDNHSEKVVNQISLTYNELGIFLLSERNYSEAYKFLNESIKFSSNNFAAHFNKGECLLNMKDLKNALDEYLKCLEIDSKNIESMARCAIIHYKFAVVSFNNKEYNEAIRHLEKALNYYEESPSLHVLKARCHLKLRKKKTAEESIKKALKIDPNYKEAIEINKMINLQI